jgi:hypothetical protein
LPTILPADLHSIILYCAAARIGKKYAVDIICHNDRVQSYIFIEHHIKIRKQSTLQCCLNVITTFYFTHGIIYCIMLYLDHRTFFLAVLYFLYIEKYAVCAQLIKWDNINVHRSSNDVLVLFLLLLTRSRMCQQFSVLMTSIKFYKNQFLWKLSCSMQTDGQADSMNLIAAWHNFFANVPKTEFAYIVTWNTAYIQWNPGLVLILKFSLFQHSVSMITSQWMQC